MSLFIPSESVPGRVGMGEWCWKRTDNFYFLLVKRYDDTSNLDSNVQRCATKRSPGLLHLLPGHLDVDLHDLRLLLHPGVHRGDGSQQDGGQETGGDGEWQSISGFCLLFLLMTDGWQERQRQSFLLQSNSWANTSFRQLILSFSLQLTGGFSISMLRFLAFSLYLWQQGTL